MISKDTQGNNNAPGGQKRNQKQRKTLILQTCRTAICSAIAVKNPQRDCKLGFLYEAYIEKVSPKRHGVVGKGTQKPFRFITKLKTKKIKKSF